MDLKYFLKNLPAFEEFSAAHLDILATHLKVAEQADGHIFIRQDSQGDAMYLLLEGSVSISRHDNGSEEEYAVRELSDGETFGMLSLLDDLPSVSTCTAKGKVTTAALTRADFEKLFDEAPPVGRHLRYMIAVQMARDLQEANKRSRTALAKA